MGIVHAIRRATQRHVVVAGGITEQREIDSLDALGIDAVVGMALYAGKIMVEGQPFSSILQLQLPFVAIA
jgi:phosphoribosylformimino-5-aminoimidazole carboxamide ribotide isomerase